MCNSRHHDPPSAPPSKVCFFVFFSKQQTPFFKKRITPIFEKHSHFQTPNSHFQETNSHFQIRKNSRFQETNFSSNERFLLAKETPIFFKKNKLSFVISEYPFEASVSNIHFQVSFKLNRCKIKRKKERKKSV